MKEMGDRNVILPGGSRANVSYLDAVEEGATPEGIGAASPFWPFIMAMMLAFLSAGMFGLFWTSAICWSVGFTGKP